MTLPVLVAPDSFKGTFSAREVAAAIAEGLAEAGRETVKLPVADGGEGTMEVLVTVLGGEVITQKVSDPLGREIEARFALLPDGSAVVETAQASGLGLVAEEERDAWAASTRGTGELIVAAAAAGRGTRDRDRGRLGHHRRRRRGTRGPRRGRRERPPRRALRRAHAVREGAERVRSAEGRRP